MQIVCPSCSSRYELDAAKLGPVGRKVRCASCRTLWHVAPAQDFPEAPSVEETRAMLDEELHRAGEIDRQVTDVTLEQEALADVGAAEASEPTPPLAATPPRRGGRARTGALGKRFGRTDSLRAPVALGLAGIAVLGLLVWQRQLAVRAAPQLAAVFESLGLPVNVRGLSLSSVESGVVDDGQGRFLVVEGDVTNIAGGVTPMPPIEVAVRDSAGQTLYTWTTQPPRPTLEPAELVRFRARLAAPPEAGTSVLVRFSSSGPTGIARAN
jgi:predicted Zn finger-like uncharacterized protein